MSTATECPEAGRWHPDWHRARRVVLAENDPRSGLLAGDVLWCVPYWLDPHDKLTVLCRESDGFNPECNVYRSQVIRRGESDD